MLVPKCVWIDEPLPTAALDVVDDSHLPASTFVTQLLLDELAKEHPTIYKFVQTTGGNMPWWG